MKVTTLAATAALAALTVWAQFTIFSLLPRLDALTHENAALRSELHTQEEFTLSVLAHLATDRPCVGCTPMAPTGQMTASQ